MQVIENKRGFRNDLLTWYETEKRDLPWRRTTNPYYIWISEVMLQQTRVDTVIPYYERFLSKYPTMQALADAEENELLKMWEGLGYYSRARNLQKGVSEVLENYNGEIPRNRKEIQKLKGIGPYTAGAILSIAFGIPEHAVDGNVMRVISRVLLIDEDISVPRNRKIFENVIMDLIDPNDPSAFNQGLMELGATICTPKPKCLLCPIREYCAAYFEGTQEEYPVKLKKTVNKRVPVASFALQDDEGKWLLVQRPSKGLLANMWEFPLVELKMNETPEQALLQQYGIKSKNTFDIKSFKHVFTHLTWDIQSYSGEIKETSNTYEFFTEKEVDALPKPVPVLKIWDAIKKGGH